MEHELADVLCFSLSLANAAGIDVSRAVQEKVKVNRLKYPVKKAKGRATKYNFSGTHTVGFNRLSTAIASDKVLTVNVSKSFTDASGTHDVAHEFGGGVTLTQNNGNATVYVSPKGNPFQLHGTSGQNISDPKNIIMGHETLGHGLENMTGGDTSQHRAIEIENQLRQEQHLDERAQDPSQ